MGDEGDDPHLYYLRLQAAIREAEDTLRERILLIAPELRHDINVMADVIRELVKLERDKAGLDAETGGLELHPNESRSSEHAPHLIGSGTVAGRRYEAAAWLAPNNVLRVALIKPRRTQNG